MATLKAVEANKVPGAWFPAAYRQRAPLSPALRNLFRLACVVRDYDRINNTGHLMAAVQDLLDLIAQDSDLLEQQLKA